MSDIEKESSSNDEAVTPVTSSSSSDFSHRETTPCPGSCRKVSPDSTCYPYIESREGKPGNSLKQMLYEIGPLPRPKWSIMDTVKAEQDPPDGTVTTDAALSSHNLFVVSFGSVVLPDPLLDKTNDVKYLIPMPDNRTDRMESIFGPSSSGMYTSSSDRTKFTPQRTIGSKQETQVVHWKERLETVETSRGPVRLLQPEANYCVTYEITKRGQLKIGLESFKNCYCSGVDDELQSPYHGPWLISIDKRLINEVIKVEADYKKMLRLKGPASSWPPETPYVIKTSPKDTCLRAGATRKKVSEVMEYIMDTNTDKFNYEPPPTVRLAWFMEEQLKSTELVNSAYDWDTDQVLEWITARIGLPQYKECFEINGIRGRHLVLLDANALENMGIRDFDHIQKITTDIRRIFKIRPERNIWRNVIEERYDPLTLHAMYNFKHVSRRMPIYNFYVDNHFLDRKIPHFSLSELKRPVWNVFPRNVRKVESTVVFEGKLRRNVRAKW